MSNAERATCRGCGRDLDGLPYYRGGRAYVSDQKDRHGMRVEARSNYYGGFVCSRSCDYRACLELEQDMPGHGITQTRVGADAMRRIISNWGE